MIVKTQQIPSDHLHVFTCYN